ncbi:hypothetical protein [Corynebacterium pygosceleis]|uniref:Uncharacterized protein n=1 Tax=Corynebacterium pygosceleis TaxID=2800406 RepID=A0A9Q4C776_9CORY|nr:hypothetical protein [Corynebacterium pygosceleis]MCK7637699.1 hypothetical protein [Corynebacterium pygosceleis]MCK7674890.1 hypothetical protein [Corynebacterium pygosceleis]MCL0119521.1 hypothetical protein [Corynebacterium pygosceleis]MCX7467972.1 hypothetical protein [Corynebacterium pygosceleis]
MTNGTQYNGDWSDGSAYDTDAVRFFDVAHEGAQVRAVAGAVGNGDLDALVGIRPRSVVIVAGDLVSERAAHLALALRSPLRQPMLVTDVLPSYVGPLDVVIIASGHADDPVRARAMSSAVDRGCPTVLIAPGRGPLAGDAPGRVAVIPEPPTVQATSPARVTATVDAVLDLLEQDRTLVVESLHRVADEIDAELVALRPERDELVNPARELRGSVEGRRVIHTAGHTVGAAVASVVAAIWDCSGLPGTVIPQPELGLALPALRRGEADLFHDPYLDDGPAVLSLRIVVWAAEDTSLPEAIAQGCGEPAPGRLAGALRLTTRGWAASIYRATE